jgi:hypothetical protein
LPEEIQTATKFDLRPLVERLAKPDGRFFLIDRIPDTVRCRVRTYDAVSSRHDLTALAMLRNRQRIAPSRSSAIASAGQQSSGGDRGNGRFPPFLEVRSVRSLTAPRYHPSPLPMACVRPGGRGRG